MELKEFVGQVLRDLVDAVEHTRTNSTRDMHLTNGKEDRTVEFDIAVSVENSSERNGKAGIRVLEFAEAGGEMSKQNKNSTVSRVRFGVHIDTLTKQEELQRSQEIERLNNREEFDSYR
ncbi:hypothetical protein KBD61_00475 [Patescibacteria group bacterium]|nr:hypothetical protein [Patescibacteria group bacterium]MBP9709481.1 hypothetical protein [Patescibacteria group bacterium]